MIALTAAAFLLGPAVSLAQEPDRRFYVAPMASYAFFDDFSDTGSNDFTVDDDVGGALAIGKRLSPTLNVELYGFQFPGLQTDSQGEIDITGYGLDLLVFPQRQSFKGYGILGYSQGEYDSDSAGTLDADFVDIGAGYEYEFTDYGLALRGEYRLRSAELDSDGGNSNDHVVSLGVLVPLGAAPEEPEPREPEPASAPEPEPLDSDGDGVINDNDECAGTPPGTEVDDTGCPKQEVLSEEEPLVLPGTNFAFNSAELRSEAEDTLDQVVVTLEENPDLELRIEGHTDGKGSKTYNQRLSKERADSVKQYLVNLGIDAGRLTTVGLGESEPLAPNTNPDGSDNPEGRAKNRRVEIHVADK